MTTTTAPPPPAPPAPPEGPERPAGGRTRLSMDPRLRARRIAVKRAAGRSRLRRAGYVAGGLAVIGAAYGLTRSPLLDVDRVSVSGASRTTVAQILDASRLHSGASMLGLDLAAVRHRVRALPWIAEVSVRREWPGVVRVEVSERVPLAAVRQPDATWRVVDAAGRVLEAQRDQPAGLVLIAGPGAVGEPGSDLPAGAVGALTVLRAVPPAVRPLVQAMSWDGTGAVQLSIEPGARVLFGRPTQIAAKFLALDTMLTAKVAIAERTQIDLRVPEAPSLLPPDASVLPPAAAQSEPGAGAKPTVTPTSAAHPSSPSTSRAGRP